MNLQKAKIINITKVLVLFIFATFFINGCAPKTDSLSVIKKNGVLKVGCHSDIKGFSYLNPSTNTYEGLEIEIAYEIAAEIFDCSLAKAKSKIEFISVTSATRGTLLDSGEVDIVLATFTITDERKEHWNFSTPYYTDYIGFLVLANSKIFSVLNLQNELIGVTSSSTTQNSVEQYLKEKNINVSFSEYDSYQAIKDALTAGDISAFASDHSILSTYSDANTVLLEDKFNEQKYGAATKLENIELSNVVDKVIKSMITTYNLK